MKNEAEAAAGVPKVNGWGMGRDDGATVTLAVEVEAIGFEGIAIVVRHAHTQLVGDLPACEQEDGNGIEGHLTASGGLAQQLGQHRAQGIKVHQAQEEAVS